jgi:hypothetical protein
MLLDRVPQNVRSVIFNSEIDAITNRILLDIIVRKMPELYIV